MRNWLVPLIVLLHGAAAAQDADSARRGQYYAARICGDCHATAAGETRSPQPGAPTFDTVANTPGMTGTALTVWLRSSHPTMPQLMVRSDDIFDLVSYLGTLKKRR